MYNLLGFLIVSIFMILVNWFSFVILRAFIFMQKNCYCTITDWIIFFIFMFLISMQASFPG